MMRIQQIMVVIYVLLIMGSSEPIIKTITNSRDFIRPGEIITGIQEGPFNGTVMVSTEAALTLYMFYDHDGLLFIDSAIVLAHPWRNSKFVDGVVLNETHILISRGQYCLHTMDVAWRYEGKPLTKYAGRDCFHGSAVEPRLTYRFTHRLNEKFSSNRMRLVPADGKIFNRLVISERCILISESPCYSQYVRWCSSLLLLEDDTITRLPVATIERSPLPTHIGVCAPYTQFYSAGRGLFARTDLYTGIYKSIRVGDQSDVGYHNGGFNQARFSKNLDGIAPISNFSVIVADRGNHVLRIINWHSNYVAAFCDGRKRTADGNMQRCSLNEPSSVYVLGKWLLIGQRGGFRTLILRDLYSADYADFHECDHTKKSVYIRKGRPFGLVTENEDYFIPTSAQIVSKTEPQSSEVSTRTSMNSSVYTTTYKTRRTNKLRIITWTVPGCLAVIVPILVLIKVFRSKLVTDLKTDVEEHKRLDEKAKETENI